MSTQTCRKCGQAFEEWAEFCSNCAQPMEDYSAPAGFWIRVGAAVMDFLVFTPIILLAFWNVLALKSTALLILTSLTGLIYKPCMESLFGATVGKMSCGIKVINDSGSKLSLLRAYIRFLPGLVSCVISLIRNLILFSSPHFESVTSFTALGQAYEKGLLHTVGTLVGLFILIDCIFAGFTFRKRALHDMLGGSFCVYKRRAK